MHEPKLWHCDVLQAPDAPESVDLIVTSPPYNLGMDYGDGASDQKDYSDYLKWIRDWLEECHRWLKPDGRMCLNVPLDTNKSGC